MRKFAFAPLALGALGLMLTTACSTTPNTPEGREALQDESQATYRTMASKDPGLENFIKNAYGYANFPDVGKGGFIVGGSYGKGVVYEQNRLIGYADITAGSVGLQAGGQSFSELLVFQNKAALDRFKAGDFDMGAGVSAVVLKAGAAAQTQFQNGLAVFTMPKGGLMAEASISGQRFRFIPLDQAGSSTTRPSDRNMDRNMDRTDRSGT